VAIGRPFSKGVSGNPGGRPQIAKAIKAAGYDPDDLRREVIEQLVNGMRTLDPASKESAPSWKFCVDRLDVRLNGPVKEFVTAEDRAEMTPEEEREELEIIAREHIAALTPEERARLVTSGTESIQ
jgi:hypothetical protein